MLKPPRGPGFVPDVTPMDGSKLKPSVLEGAIVSEIVAKPENPLTVPLKKTEKQ